MYSTPRTETPKFDALARFKRLDADQQNDLSDRLQALPVRQRQDVLAEWDIRCAAGTVRDAAAYLFGLIRKALAGTFRLWAARKVERQERAAPKVQEAPRETPMSASSMPVTEPTDKPASREAASAYLQHMQALLRSAANTTSVRTPIHATKPPKHSQTPLVRAMAQAVFPAGQPRPLAAFLASIMETGR